MTQKKLTQKQAQSRISNLLRGIDNNTSSIRKAQDKLVAASDELRKVVSDFSSISNESNKPVPKISKVISKVAKPASKVAKPASKVAKPASKVQSKTSRPQLKIAVEGILGNGKKMDRKDILSIVSKKWGYSRPSLANMLKKNSDIFFVDSENIVSLISSQNSENSATKVEKNSVTAQAV